jgi:nucleotide-binding universal stress UspA family protein
MQSFAETGLGYLHRTVHVPSIMVEEQVMKSILVPIGHRDEPALRLAANAVLRLKGLVEAVPLRMPVIPSLDWGMIGTVTVEEPGVPPEQVIADARASFFSVMQESGVDVVESDSEPGRDGPVAVWNGKTLVGNDAIGQFGRAFDLTCVSQPIGGSGSIATTEAALFDSGGPILIAPREGSQELGGNIVVAWNGSDETARTLAFAMPLLEAASHVVILADKEGTRARPPGALIQRRLRLNGIEAELRLLPEGGVLTGERLLQEAAEVGGDLLVKGAYTQSRIRQIIFGGATKHVLAHAKLPVFMAH